MKTPFETAVEIVNEHNGYWDGESKRNLIEKIRVAIVGGANDELEKRRKAERDFEELSDKMIANGFASNIMQYRVQQFMEKFDQEILTVPTVPSVEVVMLRCKLIFEEALEFITGSGCQVKYTISYDDKTGKQEILQSIIQDSKPVITEVADAIADLLVVVFGAASAYGIDAQMVFDEVHRSNMMKLWSDGKVVKPPNWELPNIEAVLKYQTDRENNK